MMKRLPRDASNPTSIENQMAKSKRLESLSWSFMTSKVPKNTSRSALIKKEMIVLKRLES